ncbi:MAG TPA: ankyrin repeat domain-containing protein [Chitinophagaceae bacterium]|nr:ankyrin repeat domain-containing protein [Chitinophagaceae bacterium]
MKALNDIIEQIELHSPEGIGRCFAEGTDPNMLFRNEPLLHELTSEYTRSPRFRECVKVFIDHGLQYHDHVLLAVLADDAGKLQKFLNDDPALLTNRYTLRCAYTPLQEASLLHICAEFNHTDCARVLLNAGMDVNVKAGEDEHGFGGQTPLFHTVNQNRNQSEAMMHLLLEHGAQANITVKGLIWGNGYEWETLIPAVNPVSYALMGLLPQMHRDEQTVMNVVSILLKYAYGIDYTPGNVPNAYLKQDL